MRINKIEMMDIDTMKVIPTQNFALEIVLDAKDIEMLYNNDGIVDVFNNFESTIKITTEVEV